MVGEQDPVKVIDFMLYAESSQSFGLALARFTVQVGIVKENSPWPDDLLKPVGKR